MSERTAKGDWFTTFSAIKFYPLDPKPEDVRIEDIAHALSMLCRYVGHCRQFYSVAQHSVHVAELVRELAPAHPALALQALIHDAPEAYIGDMVRPLKYFSECGSAYRLIENRIEAVIYEALEVPKMTSVDKAYIKEADNTLLMTERRDLINHRNVKWSTPNKPLDHILKPMLPAEAEAAFLSDWDHLSTLCGLRATQ